MKATDIAKEAARLINGDRNTTHGDIYTTHAVIAATWNGYLTARQKAGKVPDLDAEDVANMMECLKISRRLSGAFNIDDYVDGCGYSAVAGEIAQRSARGRSDDGA